LKGGRILNKIDTNISGKEDKYSGTEDKYELVYSFSNLEIYFIPTTKYKTNTITFFFIDNLRKETVSMNALIPAVLRRGCRKYPDMNEISLQMEKLYGASFDCGVIKKGEYHIIFFYAECISDSYIPEKIKNDNHKDLFRNCLDLLVDIITDPITKNGGFKSDFLVSEKENLKRLIEGRINDKVSYSIDRCFEEMCKDEPYSIFRLGDLQGLNDVDEKKLYNHYMNVIHNYPLKVFICGNVSDKDIEYLKNLLVQKRNKTININMDYMNTSHCHKAGNQAYITDNQNHKNKEIKEVVEFFDVTQAKLSIGFRANVYPVDKDFHALFVTTGILDGDMNSKLFKNVREKAGLAYYIFSLFEKFKGIILISCGIDAQNKEKTVELILEQIAEIKSGNISEIEYKSALKSIENAINSIRDDQLQVIDFYLDQVLSKTNESFDGLIEKTKKVTISDIIEVSKKVEPEVIYLLSSSN